jgi:hypothetical protein
VRIRTGEEGHRRHLVTRRPNPIGAHRRVPPVGPRASLCVLRGVRLGDRRVGRFPRLRGHRSRTVGCMTTVEPDAPDHPRTGRTVDGAVEGAVRRGDHDRALHRLRRLRGHLPARRDRLRARGGQVHPVPPRRGTGSRQLHPRVRRRRRLHHLHPGVSPLPCLGAVGRHAPVRPGSRTRRDGRHLAPALPHPGERQDGARDGPGRRPRLGDADLAARQRLHRRRAGQRCRGRRRLEGQAGGRVHQGTRSSPPQAAATRTARTRWRFPRRGRRATSAWR